MITFTFSQHLRMITGLDGTWPTAALNNGLILQNQICHWRAVQLETSKLLEMGCILPATLLPHFQMYRWAFVDTELSTSSLSVQIVNGNMSSSSDESLATPAQIVSGPNIYVPHIKRIARLMDLKYTVHSPVSGYQTLL